MSYKNSSDNVQLFLRKISESVRYPIVLECDSEMVLIEKISIKLKGQAFLKGGQRGRNVTFIYERHKSLRETCHSLFRAISNLTGVQIPVEILVYPDIYNKTESVI